MRIGMPLSRDDVETPLSEHFGKAKWLLVWDDAQPPLFLRNTGLNGGWAAQALAAEGCRVVAVAHAGPGALGHLKALGIAVLQAPAGVPAREIARRAAAGELRERTDPPGAVPAGIQCSKMH